MARAGLMTSSPRPSRVQVPRRASPSGANGTVSRTRPGVGASGRVPSFPGQDGAAPERTARPTLEGRACIKAGHSVVANADLRPQPDQRVVLLVDDSFLHRNDGVVGDLDVLGADLGAALGDVAQADPLLVPGELGTIGVCLQRVHGELGCPDQEPRPGEGLLVVVVVADHVTDVLAQEALDAPVS